MKWTEDNIGHVLGAISGGFDLGYRGDWGLGRGEPVRQCSQGSEKVQPLGFTDDLHRYKPTESPENSILQFC